ncbi:MAG: fluoride exporter [Thermomicrobiales bacterium]|nr:fluoride exporter [Thermomicrobiales bacterium]
MRVGSEPAGRHWTAESEAVGEAELGGAPSGAPRLSRPWQPRLADVATVGIGGVLGANGRYQVGEWVGERWGTAFPWGTLLINVSGSLALGFFLASTTGRLRGGRTTRLFVATGFLGGYTTFSTFGYEAVRLLQDGDVVRAVLYVVASLIVGMVAVVVGMAAARAD